MKNKIIRFFLTLVFIASYNNQVNSKELIFESEYIEIKDNGNSILAKNGVKIIINDKVEITADESFYNKITLELLLKGNVIFIDAERDIKILSKEATYDKGSEKILSKGKVTVYLANGYTLYTENLEYSKIDSIIQSRFKSKLVDRFNNETVTTNFKYSNIDKIFRGDNIKMTDESKNSYFFKKSIIDLNKNLLLAKDVEIDFAKNTFENNMACCIVHITFSTLICSVHVSKK